MRYAGILLTLLIIAIWAVFAFGHLGGTGTHTVDWWYAHPDERAKQLAWCNDHPQQQDGTECTLPIGDRLHSVACGRSALPAHAASLGVLRLVRPLLLICCLAAPEL